MKKNNILYVLVGLISLAIVNTVVFLLVKEFTIVRCVNIAFLNLSILILWGFSIIVGKKESRFLNYSRFPIVGLYSTITFIMSAILIMINYKNLSVTIGIQVIMLGIFGIVLSLNTMANNSSKETSAVDKNNYNKVLDMSKRIDSLMQKVDNKELYKKIEKTYDSVKNAKVTTNGDTTKIDNDILQSIGILESSVLNDNQEEIENQLKNINNLIYQRNNM